MGKRHSVDTKDSARVFGAGVPGTSMQFLRFGSLLNTL
jgi:hypothetical protein